METFPISLTALAEDPHSTLPKVPRFIFKWSSLKLSVVLRVPLCPLNYLVPEPLFCFVLFHFCLKGRGLEMTTSVTARNKFPFLEAGLSSTFPTFTDKEIYSF